MNAAVVFSLCVAAGLVLSWLWRPPQKLEGGVRLLIIAYALLGVWALFFGWFAPNDEPEFFAIWKPTLLFWTLAVILIVAPFANMGYPVSAIFGTYFALSRRQWRWMNVAFAAAFVLLGAINLLVAFKLSRGNWEGFKYSLLVLTGFIILLRLNFVWLEIAARVVIGFYRRRKALLPAAVVAVVVVGTLVAIALAQGK